MLEADVKTSMRLTIQKSGGYATRIEDQYRVGFPDMILILEGGPTFFAEVKVIDGNKFGPTPRQLVELNRIKAAKAPSVFPVVIGWKDHRYYISAPKQEADISTCESDTDLIRLLRNYVENRIYVG